MIQPETERPTRQVHRAQQRANDYWATKAERGPYGLMALRPDPPVGRTKRAKRRAGVVETVSGPVPAYRGN